MCNNLLISQFLIADVMYECMCTGKLGETDKQTDTGIPVGVWH